MDGYTLKVRSHLTSSRLIHVLIKRLHELPLLPAEMILYLKDTLESVVIAPTREAVPDLKDFLFDLYGDAAMTDDQILATLIGR